MLQHRRSAHYAACSPVEGRPTDLNQSNPHRWRAQARFARHTQRGCKRILWRSGTGMRCCCQSAKRRKRPQCRTRISIEKNRGLPLPTRITPAVISLANLRLPFDRQSLSLQRPPQSMPGPCMAAAIPLCAPAAGVLRPREPANRRLSTPTLPSPASGGWGGGALRVVVLRHPLVSVNREPSTLPGGQVRAGRPLAPIGSCKGRCRSGDGPSQRDEPATATHARRPANRPPARP